MEASPMSLNHASFQVLMKRLERVERQNIVLKRSGMALLAVIGAILLTGQAPSVPRTVVAQEFLLKDASGAVRGRLDATEKGSNFTLFDASGQARASLNADADGSALVFDDGEKKAHEKMNARLTVGVIFKQPEVLITDEKGQVLAGMHATDSGPSIELNDERGYSSILGVMNLETPKSGEKRMTSAASIVLLGNDQDHHVIWQAPQNP
jgi:hypothetical protein